MSKRAPAHAAAASGGVDALDGPTRQALPSAGGGAVECIPALTVLCHPDARRVGERAELAGLAAGETTTISRTSPRFDHPGARAPKPLADPFLSRDSLASIRKLDGVIVVQRDRTSADVRVDGEPLTGARSLRAEELERGVVVELADRCVLLLHWVDGARGRRAPSFDLVGESDAIRGLRRDIERVAATELRVLIRGETGSGKELVARAIHRSGARSARPFEGVNMGAVQPSLSASALFGHVRGAFSGAVADHDGHFAAAHGGTLFLDEIGDTDPGVQAMLLRTLETGELVRVGDRRARAVDVRLLTATDADLEAAVANGKFREPLLHRIAELTLRVPALRERRDDIGRLVVHLLRELLDEGEQAALLDGIGDRPWLAAGVVARLARAPWTGNVRQLRNVVRQLVVHGRGEPTLELSAEIESALRDPPGVAPAVGPGRARGRDSIDGDAPVRGATKGARRKRPQELTEDDVLRALEQTGWKRAAAAERLGIARSSLYAFLAENPRIGRSQDLTRAAIEAALAHGEGDVARAAAALQLSEHGLKLRMQALGIQPAKPA